MMKGTLLRGLVEAAERKRDEVARRDKVAPRRYDRVRSTVITAILATKFYAYAVGGEGSAPTDDELRDLWNVLAEIV